jgi:hypothetical protein
MSDAMKDVIDPPTPPTRRGVAGQVGLSVLLSVLCSVPITLAIVRYGHLADPASGQASTPETFQQAGKFKVVAGQEGSVNFPIPYQFPPSVETDATGFNKTIIVETTTQGFRWKNTAQSNTAQSDIFNDTNVNWTAKGVVRRP